MSIYRDRIIESAARDLREGAEVHTADGYRLGEITEIDGAFAKVARPLRRDIWLRAEHLLADGEAFCTSFARSDLAVYQLRAPIADPLDETADAPSSSAILSDEEQEQQRIQMEAELAAQRRQLAAGVQPVELRLVAGAEDHQPKGALGGRRDLEGRLRVVRDRHQTYAITCQQLCKA